eukprot:Nitzschia sp. Nitz4//scaffold89_size161592//100819//108047//NITZ4_002387-RA/size161592-processed-gene-0.198-mRNA-1//1//CDS//3329559643//653//frame0
MRVPRRRSSVQSGLGSSNNNPRALAPKTYFLDTTHPIPPYLELACTTAASSQSQEADAAAGPTQSVLQRASSLVVLSRLPNVASNISIGDSTHSLPPAPDVFARKEATRRNSRSLPSPVSAVDAFSNQANFSRDPSQDPNATPGNLAIEPSWRLRDRTKTSAVALILCLNIGYEMPDRVMPHPFPKLQCWMDPSSVPRYKAKDLIAQRLEAQYARWQQQSTPRRSLKFKHIIDPTIMQVNSLCTSLRQDRQDRILLHYNGHGVPRPTPDGEIWVFDQDHNNYVPLAIADLKQWIAKPTMFVLDCSSAGILLPILTSDTPPSNNPGEMPPREPSPVLEDPTAEWNTSTIVLCATSPGEWLPLNPDYPIDIFTSCLTTPIQMALRWFVRGNPHSMGSLSLDAVDDIPGQANDRKTPLGELNWIFTAVTDSIAWDVLPKPLFQQLFRQDLLVAGVFRNFLLADRILKSLNVTPQSYPPLPHTITDHPLWHSWDLACETCLFNLMKEGLLGNSGTASKNANDENATSDVSSPSSPKPMPPPSGGSSTPSTVPNKTSSKPDEAKEDAAKKTSHMPSSSTPFFTEQLQAFEVWLEYAERHRDMVHELESPVQLPVVLQVLLSQVYRVRALELLRRFLDFGPWAVNLALTLGIQPYVMKLLPSPEYTSPLVSIWASILKFDPSCQVDLVKDSRALPNLVKPLENWSNPQGGHRAAARQRTLAAFTLSATCHMYPPAQVECLRQGLHAKALALHQAYLKLEDEYREQLKGFRENDQRRRHGQYRSLPPPDPKHNNMMSPTDRVWFCICLGNWMQKCSPTQDEAYRSNVHVCLLSRLQDENSSVRAAAAYALGCLLEHDPTRVPSLQGRSIASPLAPQGPGAQNLQGASQLLFPQQMSISAGLTASAVLSGQMQPVQWQQQMQLGGQSGRPPASRSQQQTAQGLLQPQTAMAFAGGQPQAQGVQPLQMQGRLAFAPQPGNVTQGMNSSQTLAPQLQPLPAVNLSIPGFTLGGNSTAPTGNQSLQAQNSLRPQMGASLFSGSQLMSSSGQPLLMNPQGGLGLPNASLTGMNPLSPATPPPAQLRRQPTLYEDRVRLERDLGVLERLTGLLTDGSATVRYEIMMALVNGVEKYSKAFLVVADESATRGSDDSSSNGGDGTLGVTQQDDSDSVREKQIAVPIPSGLNRTSLDRFANCWQAIRSVRSSDPHSKVSQLSNKLVGIVHENLWDTRQAINKEGKYSRASSASGLSGIAEEDYTDKGLRSPDVSLGKQLGIQPRSDGPDHRLQSKFPLRRATSEQGNMRGGKRMEVAGPNATFSPPPGPTPADPLDMLDDESYVHKSLDQYDLPKSTFYLWKKESFNSNLDDSASESWEDRDPLNPKGAARAYRKRRNDRVHHDGAKLGAHFVDLHRKNVQGDWGTSDESLNDNIKTLKRELKLRESRLLEISGAKKITHLKFHSYEDALVVCDNSDGISVWDYENGTRKLSFKNGSKQGSAMTCTTWINEKTESKLLVGSNDGSVRVWSNIIDERGQVSGGGPRIASAFMAIPDLETGTRGNDLVCEWQQSSGSLIVGGNSRNIHHWDLAQEKCVTSFETGTDALVTALTTAWNEDMVQGFDPDVVVAGHSDGLLKLFDVRCPHGVGQFGGKPRRHVRFSEHQSWIVDTAFTTYGGRYELVSGSLKGDLRWWDLRSSRSLRSVEALRGPMTALAVHRQIPVLAAGSADQHFKTVTGEGDFVQMVRSYEGLSGKRLDPVCCMEFHKQKLVLASGGTNSLGPQNPQHCSRCLAMKLLTALLLLLATGVDAFSPGLLPAYKSLALLGDRFPTRLGSEVEPPTYSETGPPPDLPSLLLHNRIVYIGMPLVSQVTELIIAELLYLNYESTDTPITMYINSPGSTTSDGRAIAFESEAFAIADVMNYVKPQVHTVAIGQAYGTAAMLLSQGSKGKRFALPHASILLNQPRTQTSGQAVDIAIKAKEVARNRKKTCEMIASSCGKPVDTVIEDCSRLKYLQPKEAVEYGLIDRVLEHGPAKALTMPSFMSALREE